MRKRQCYWFNGEIQNIQVVQDVSDENGNMLYKKGKTLQGVSVDALLDILIEIIDIYPKLSPLQALRTIFPSVCPKSFITEEIDMLLSMESFCRDYHLPPLGKEVGYLDYPVVFIETFATISSARERITMQELSETNK